MAIHYQRFQRSRPEALRLFADADALAAQLRMALEREVAAIDQAPP